jgi:hypothetical protein
MDARLTAALDVAEGAYGHLAVVDMDGLGTPGLVS